MYVIVSLLCAAVLSVCTAQEYDVGCDTAVLKTAIDIFNDQCGDFFGMYLNSTFYPNCIESYGFSFYKSSLACNSKPIFANRRPKSLYTTVMNACNRRTSKQFLCCLLTDELKSKPGVTPQEKYEVSKECIKEYYDEYPKLRRQ